MAKTTRRAAALLMTILGLAARVNATPSPAAIADQRSLMASDARVRGGSPRVATDIIEATAQSQTFRGLVDLIGTTDGIALIREGRCGRGMRACLLLTMTIAGPNRLLFILVDPRASDRDLMASIGHELQHAVEVLSDRQVRNGSAMRLLFKEMCQLCQFQFETEAAVRAGDAVRAELQKSAAAERRE